MSRAESSDRWTPLAIALFAGIVIGVCGWRVASALRAVGADAKPNVVAAHPADGGGGDAAANASSGAANRTATRGNTVPRRNGTVTTRPGSLTFPTPPRIDPARAIARLADRRAERATAAANAAQPTPIVPEPAARVALDYVGADAVAEEIWETAINDPALTADQRSNLIEDLNENGFRDPNNVQPDELPLVMSRLDLIEQLAPDAMDQANAAAFQEAYKDLTNIANRLQPPAQTQADATQTPTADATQTPQ